MRSLHPWWFLHGLLALLLLAALAATARGQPAVPVEEATVEVSPGIAPAADPAGACFEAASAGGRDAYVCDLAVQMARDSGDGPALAAALANRSLVLSTAGRLQPALDDVSEALTLTPTAADLHGNLGNLLLRLGRPSEALNAHDRAIELSPEDPVGYYNRAFSYLALGQPQLADRDLSAARMLSVRTAGISRREIPDADARPAR